MFIPFTIEDKSYVGLSTKDILAITFRLLILACIVFVLDAVFLYSTSSFVIPIYQKIQHAPVTIRYYSAILCYLAIVLGIYYFIIRENRPIHDAFLLGIFVYGVYDLTVLSVFSKYTLEIALMDMLWGGILFTSSVAIYRNIIRGAVFPEKR
jgi:uncharacterized membrane protein